MVVANPGDRIAGLSSGDVSVARARASPNRFIWTHHHDQSTCSGAETLAARQQSRGAGTQTTCLTSDLQPSGIQGLQHRSWQSHRQTNPLCPTYHLASPGDQPRPLKCHASTYRPISRSLDTSDIPGARAVPARFSSPDRRNFQNLDYRDVRGTQPRPSPGAREDSLSTADIECSTPMARTRRSVESPGRGTLCNSDIRGALPGLNRGHEGVPTSWGLGRFPLPSVQQSVFGYGARQTVLQRPTGYEMFDRRSRWHP